MNYQENQDSLEALETSKTALGEETVEVGIALKSNPFALAGALAATLSLAACGGGSAGVTTPTPTPTPTVAATEVTGIGSIATSGGHGDFSMNVSRLNAGKTKGSFSYSDSSAQLFISTTKLSNLVITGNHATFSGTAKAGKKQKLNFTVDVTDNGDPGSADTFSITVNNGYSAAGTLTSGNIKFQ